MASELVLPEELLQQILSELAVDQSTREQEYHARLQTVAAFARASKQCLRLARPILYRQPLLYNPQWLPDESFRLHGLVRSVCTNPHLAEHIRCIWFYAHQYEYTQGDYTRGFWNTALQGKDNMAALRQLCPVPDRVFQELEKQLLSGHDPAYIVVLLILGRNIQCLHFDCAGEEEFLPMSAFFKHVADNRQNPDESTMLLPKLVELEVHDPNGRNYPFDDLLQPLKFPCIPSLRIFRGHQVEIRDWSLGEPGEEPWPLREIYLSEGMTDLGGIQALLYHCPKLEVLDVQWDKDCNDEWWEFYDAVFWSSMAETLVKQGQSLRRLTLECPEWVFDSFTDGVLLGFGDLTSLTMLQELSVPAVALMGELSWDNPRDPDWIEPDLASTLPSSLRKLTVLGYHRVELEQLEEQLNAVLAAERLFELRAIELWSAPRWEETSTIERKWTRSDSSDWNEIPSTVNTVGNGQ